MLYSTISPILMKQKKYDEPLFIMIHRISIFIVFYFFFDGAGWHPLHPPQLPPQLLQLFPDFLSFQTFRAARPTMHATMTKTTNVPIFIPTSSFFSAVFVSTPKLAYLTLLSSQNLWYIFSFCFVCHLQFWLF